MLPAVKSGNVDSTVATLPNTDACSRPQQKEVNMLPKLLRFRDLEANEAGHALFANVIADVVKSLNGLSLLATDKHGESVIKHQ
jgi:hypothetical protein